MRNLLVYPVTLDEKIDYLERLMKEALSEELIGDMRPILCQEIIEDLRKLYE